MVLKRCYVAKVKHVSFIPDSGSYMLVLYSKRDFKEKIGRLGLIDFKKGYYVYVGTAKKRMKNRIARHISKEKRKRWHIDYITSITSVIPLYVFIVKDFKECELARFLKELAKKEFKGFGSSDCRCSSHFYRLSGLRDIGRLFYNVSRSLCKGKIYPM